MESLKDLESLKVLESYKVYTKYLSSNFRESTGGSLAITMIISICNKYIIYFLERLKDYRR